MEIKIDTKKDSADDIKKTIEFLKTLVGASSSGSADFNADSSASSGMVGLFGDTPVLSNDTPKASEDEDEEEEKDKIELIPY
jgi:hypothetical protein